MIEIQQKNLLIMIFTRTMFSKLAAEYYGRSIDDIDWLSSIGFFVGIPSVLIGSWGINRYGLRYHGFYSKSNIIYNGEY